MFTAQQYRAKAAEYDDLLAATRSPAEIAKYRDRKQSYTSHADNLDWLAENVGKTVNSYEREPTGRKRRDRCSQGITDLEEDKILRCLGAAVVMNLNTIPAKLRRALFEGASSLHDGHESALLKDSMARFMRDHEDDAQNQFNN